MNQLRRDFSLPSNGTIAAATVYMSGIGFSSLLLNGRPVDPSRVLDPGWTTYQKRTLYVSLAVESLLHPGGNALGVTLGNGWYAQEQYMIGQQQPTYGPPRLWLWLHVQYADNSTVEVSSDASWLGASGPVIHDGLYAGSVVDHRWAREGWAVFGYRDETQAWINASVLPSPVEAGGVMVLQPMDPQRLPPYNFHVATSGSQGNPPGVKGGDLVAQRGGVIQPTAVGGLDVQGQPFEVGQNLAGWCRFKLTGRRGSSVFVRWAETMERPGPQTLTSLYGDNLQNAASTDIFVFSKDDEEEVFTPGYTSHGFRYVEVRGHRNTITADKIECYFVHSEVRLIGNVTFDNTVMNQVRHTHTHTHTRLFTHPGRGRVECSSNLLL